VQLGSIVRADVRTLSSLNLIGSEVEGTGKKPSCYDGFSPVSVAAITQQPVNLTVRLHIENCLVVSLVCTLWSKMTQN